MQTKQRASVDSSQAEETMRSSPASGGVKGDAVSAKADERANPEPEKKGQTRHYLAMEASPVEEVMFSTLPSGATDAVVFLSKNASHATLGELRHVYRSLGYPVVVDIDPERGSFLKVTVDKEPERILNTLVERQMFPASPEEKLRGEPEKVGRIEKFREKGALKAAPALAVASQGVLMANSMATRDADKFMAGLTFAITNLLAAMRGTGKRGGEVEALVAKAYQELGLANAGVPPVDALHFKDKQENIQGVRKVINKAVDFAWNKHPYEIGEVAATVMNAQMTFNRKGKQNDKWWLLNTFTSFVAGGTLGFVPPKKHVAEGEELQYPDKGKKAWSFIQTHSTKIGGAVNLMSNIFAVMSGVKAVQNYKTFKEQGEDALVTRNKKGEIVDTRLPANLSRKEVLATVPKEDRPKIILPKVPLNQKQRYFATAVTAMTTSIMWLGVGLMTMLGNKNKKRDGSDTSVLNDLAAKSAEMVLQVEPAQQPEIARRLATFFGEQKDVKGKSEDIYNLIVQKAEALRSSPFLSVDFSAAAPAAGAKPEHQQEAAKQPSVAERVGAAKREGQWAEQPGIVSDAKEPPKPKTGQWAEQPENDPAMRKENPQHMSAV